MIDTALRISVSSRSATVRVTAKEGALLDAGNAKRRDMPDGTIVIESDQGGSKRIDLVVPSGSHLSVGTASGSIELSGSFASARIVTGSGRVEVDDVTDLDVRTASGRVEVRRCDGDCRIVTKSGRVEVGHARSVDISTVSGRVEAGVVDRAAVTTVSATVAVGATAAEPELRIRTVSGKVDVEVAKAVSPDLTLQSVNGRVRCDCDDGTDGAVTVETISGSIQVRRR